MSRKVQVLGRSGRNTLQKSTTFNLSTKRQSQFQRLDYLPTVPGPVATDSNFKDTVLLIHADGTSGANNTVFLDSSSYKYVPFSGTFSNYFNGSTDYLSFASNSAFDQNVAFTLECWVYRASGSSASGYFFAQLTSGYLTLLFNSSGNFIVDKSFVGNQITSSSTFAMDTWHHVALCYDGTNTRLFVNGGLQGTMSGGGVASATTTTIGVYLTGTNYFQGYVSNFRIVRGTALYTSSFTTPTTPLTAITNTSLLTCQSSQFKDNSTNNLSITQNGTPAISAGGTAVKIGAGKPAQGTFNPFNNNGWSMYFPGSSSNYINMAADGNNTIGTGDFTLEYWFNSPNVTAGTSIMCSHQIGGMFATGTAAGGVLSAVFNQDGGASDTKVGPSTSYALSNNTWYHIAVTRVGTLLTLYVNGTSAGTYTLGAGTNIGSYGGAKPFYIGAGGDLASWYTGYLYGVRFVKGTALYTTNFNPLTSRLSANVSGIRFLICDVENPSTTNRLSNGATDVSGTYTGSVTLNGTLPIVYNSPFTTSGNLATTAKGGSVFFNGSSDYIITTADAAFGTGDFTIEFWVYFNSTSGTQDLFDTRPAGTASTPQYVAIELVSGALNYYTNNANPAISGGTLLAKSWYHIALCRSGTSTRMFINGIQTGSTYSDSQNYVNGANRPALGIDANALNTSYFNGFMSNVKVIKGKALYTTNFSIPTAPATSTDAPTLLLNATNAGITDQTGRNNFLTYGTASVSSTQSKFGGASMYFDGSTGYLTTSNTYTQFGTTDFTVECWTYLTSKVTTYPCIFSNYNAYTAGSIALFAGHNSGTTTAYQVSYNGSTFPTSINGGTVNYNTWVHLAVVRSGTVITLYVNGSSVGTITGATAALNGVGSNFYIGTSGDTISTAYIAGYIDDFRVSKIARYTANFTPPTSAFPDL